MLFDNPPADESIKKGKTQGAGLARNREADAEQFGSRNFPYQISSVGYLNPLAGY
jgi:hypothetical protein